MKCGKLIHGQMASSIKSHEKIFLILSENSMDSEWAKTEIIKQKIAKIRKECEYFSPSAL